MSPRESIATITVAFVTFLWSCADHGTNALNESAHFRIAYFTDQFDSLRVISADGSGDAGITKFNTKGISTDWFPNNHTLVFSDANGDSSVLWLLDVRTGSKKSVFTTQRASIHNLRVAPNGQKMACTIYYWNNTGSQLFVLESDGRNPIAVTPADRFVWEIDWSPTSSQIIMNLEHRIWEVFPDGSHFREIQTDSGQAFQPAYSPDGTHICYSLNRDTTSAIYVMLADGSDPRPITPLDRSYKGSPQWSPDGLDIVYVQDDSHHVARVFSMTSSGERRRQLSTVQGTHFAPRWIANECIVFFSNETMDLWIVDRNGSQTSRLTQISPEQRGSNLIFAVSKTPIL